MHADRRRRVLRARVHWHAGRRHEQQAVAGNGEFGFVPSTGVAAEQRNRPRRAEIGTTPLKLAAHGTRAFAMLSKNLLQPARIAIAARAENCGIENTGGIGRHQLAALHPLHVHNAHTVARVNPKGDGARARHGVSLFTRREGAGPYDDCGPRRPWPDGLVTGQSQN